MQHCIRMSGFFQAGAAGRKIGKPDRPKGALLYGSAAAGPYVRPSPAQEPPAAVGLRHARLRASVRSFDVAPECFISCVALLRSRVSSPCDAPHLSPAYQQQITNVHTVHYLIRSIVTSCRYSRFADSWTHQSLKRSRPNTTISGLYNVSSNRMAFRMVCISFFV